MAVVLLALNGVGLGHLMRTTVVSQALAAIGEHPIIFSGREISSEESGAFPRPCDSLGMAIVCRLRKTGGL